MRPNRLLSLIALCCVAYVITMGRLDSLDTGPSAPPPSSPAAATGSVSEETIRTQVERWRPLVVAIFPEEAVEDVLSVMACESQGVASARFTEEWGVDSVGLMQINKGWLTGWGRPEWSILSHNGSHVDLTDPAANLQAAKFIRFYEDAMGHDPWSQWACRPGPWPAPVPPIPEPPIPAWLPPLPELLSPEWTVLDLNQ